VIKIANTILKRKLKDVEDGMLGKIDYDDQVWLPVARPNHFPIPQNFQFSWILVGEAQELLPVQIVLLKRIFKAYATLNPRIIVVGNLSCREDLKESAKSLIIYLNNN
jgi:hypothetical protein